MKSQPCTEWLLLVLLNQSIRLTLVSGGEEYLIVSLVKILDQFETNPRSSTCNQYRFHCADLRMAPHTRLGFCLPIRIMRTHINVMCSR